ncbi:MAG: Osmosensitive channel histidine kinaselike protein [Acidimicrobiales bacterium]|nr:Osmosensitive channel histidine kinaselike protein [Acidimicrobiales bacterium]
MPATDRTLLGVSVGGMVALAVAGLLVPLRDVIDSANVALLLAVVVVMAAGFGGRLAGGVTALLAAVAFDFAHTQPYGSLKIANVEDLLAAALLCVVGLLAGELSDRLQRVRQRRSQLGELQRLRRVASRATSGDSSEDLTLQVGAELLECLGLRDCWYEPAPFLAELPRLEPDGSLSTRTYRWAAGGFELPRDGVSMPVWASGRLLGRFVLAPTAGTGVAIERRLVALALVDQLAVILTVRAA